MHKEQGWREQERDQFILRCLILRTNARSREYLGGKRSKNCGSRYQKWFAINEISEWIFQKLLNGMHNTQRLDIATVLMTFDLSSFGMDRKTLINVEVDKTINTFWVCFPILKNHGQTKGTVCCALCDSCAILVRMEETDRNEPSPIRKIQHELFEFSTTILCCFLTPKMTCGFHFFFLFT